MFTVHRIGKGGKIDNKVMASTEFSDLIGPIASAIASRLWDPNNTFRIRQEQVTYLVVLSDGEHYANVKLKPSAEYSWSLD